jgi:hypothetical protein
MFLRSRVIFSACSSIYHVLLHVNYFITHRTIILRNTAIYEYSMGVGFVELFQLAQIVQAKNNDVIFGISTS